MRSAARDQPLLVVFAGIERRDQRPGNFMGALAVAAYPAGFANGLMGPLQNRTVFGGIGRHKTMGHLRLPCSINDAPTVSPALSRFKSS